MTLKERFKRNVLFAESFGFALIILMLWADEVLDFPHLIFGVPATPANLVESAIESFLVLIMAGLVMTLTDRLISRIQYLEGILPICSFCHKIRFQKDWVAVEEYVSERSGADFSHTVCPDCYRIHYGDHAEKPPMPTAGKR